MPTAVQQTQSPCYNSIIVPTAVQHSPLVITIIQCRQLSNKHSPLVLTAIQCRQLSNKHSPLVLTAIQCRQLSNKHSPLVITVLRLKCQQLPPKTTFLNIGNSRIYKYKEQLAKMFRSKIYVHREQLTSPFSGRTSR